MNCNFPILDEPIQFSDEVSNVLVIEDIRIYSKIIYALYQYDLGIEPDYSFIIFDDDFNKISNFLVILNPLTFDFNTSSMKKTISTYITSMLGIDEVQEIESMYNEVYQYFNKFLLENIGIEISMCDSCKIDDMLKLLKISIEDNSVSIFERTQLILNVLHEFSKKKLVIFCGLGTMIDEEEYNLIIETVKLNQQRVLFIENQDICNLKRIKEIKLDKDFFCTEKML